MLESFKYNDFKESRFFPMINYFVIAQFVEIIEGCKVQLFNDATQHEEEFNDMKYETREESIVR